MKITANVEVSYWQQPAAGRRPSQRSSMVIGKQTTTNELFLLVQNAQNKVGVKYKIKGNVEKVFTRFAKEGKATIRFREPPHDLIIRCDDALLFRTFLSVLGQGERDAASVPETRLSSLYSGAAVPKRTARKAEITDAAEYPRLGGFPRTLTSLAVRGIGMKRIEQRVLCLRNLVSLDFSHNLVESVPPSLGDLPLATLDLSHNRLAATDWTFLHAGRLRATLRSLCVAGNALTSLPPSVGDLAGLVGLDVGDNELTTLPGGLGRLSGLRSLNMSGNAVARLPGLMRKLRLDHMDVSGNTFEPCEDPVERQRDIRRCIDVLGPKQVPSLVELAARVVVEHRIRFRDVVPPRVCSYLDEAKYCECGDVTFECGIPLSASLDLRSVAHTVVTGDGVTSRVPTAETFCSTRFES